MAMAVVLVSPILADEDLRQTPVVKAIQRAKPAVVNIQGNKIVTESTPGESKTQTVNGMGTGVIIDDRGYVITCYHVVQDVAKIEVTLADGTETRARLLNFDPSTDLALIKLDLKEPLPTINIGSSHDLLEGEQVIAIGNPFGYRDSVSVGIISGLHRNVQVNGNQEYKNLVQTSADINPGNSGGPLININGDMIGINVAVRMGAQGIGFAIPVDAALEVIADLVSSSQRQKVGLNIECRRAWEMECPYLEVEDVADNRSNTSDDLKRGDRILRVAGRTIKSRLDMELALIGLKPGEPLQVEAERAGSRLNLTKVVSNGTLPSSLGVRSASGSIQDSSDGVEKDIWERIGVRVVPVDASSFRKNSGYNGGLKVTEVRPSSQASQQGIHVGDVLIGIMDWNTATFKDMKWVLANPKFQNNAASVYIYRNNTTYVGTLNADRRTTR